MYDGYVFDKVERLNNFFQYVVYIPEIKMISKFISDSNFDNIKHQKFKLYIFENETSFKKKVRLQMITE